MLPNDEPEAGQALEAVFASEGILRATGRAVRVKGTPTGHELTADAGGVPTTAAEYGLRSFVPCEL